MPPPPGFHLERLRAGIRPFRLHWFPRLRSTNDHAAGLRRRGDLYAPAIVLTGHQTAGRGRAGNRWWSNAGVLTVTFVLPIEEHLAPHQLPLVAGLAVRAAAAELCGTQHVLLKWPNDILHEGRKLAGLLCERLNKVDLVGLGMNVNARPGDAPRALRERVTSLANIAKRPFDPTDVLVNIAGHLLRTMSQWNERPFAQMLREYDQHHALVGKQVTVIGGADGQVITGKCEGLDTEGRLKLRGRGGVRAVMNGHVEMRR